MTSFPLKIVTPEGVCYDGFAESVTVRTITGYMGILAGHMDITTALSCGEARVTVDGKVRKADCQSGMLSVQTGTVTLLPAVFRWIEE